MAINSNKEVNVDVLVIGGGNAALCAALMAREAGAGVLLLEAAPREWRGGNSAHTHNLRCMHDAPQLGMSASRPKPACWRPAASSPTARPDASTYKGGAPALQDLLGGRVAAYYSTPATAGPHIESGRLIPLATTGLTRPAFLPNVPTIAESGYPGFNALNWYAFVAPGKTPKLILDRWNLELVKVLNSPDVKEALLKRGLIPAPGSRDELARFMVSETTTWGRIVRERKITAD